MMNVRVMHCANTARSHSYWRPCYWPTSGVDYTGKMSTNCHCWLNNTVTTQLLWLNNAVQ